MMYSAPSAIEVITKHPAATAITPEFLKSLFCPILTNILLHESSSSQSLNFSSNQAKTQSVKNSKKARFLTCLMKNWALGGTLIYQARKYTTNYSTFITFHMCLSPAPMARLRASWNAEK